VSKSHKSGLGKGFDVLMPTDFDQSILLDQKERIQKLFINTIIPNVDQPRRHFDEASLQELADSIKQYGILQPLIVSPYKDSSYLLIAGERRWRAAQIAGLHTVPAIVREQKELEQLEIALIENVQRVDLSPLEQAVSIERLHQQFNLTYQQIANRLGKAVTTLNNIVRLLQLPTNAWQSLQTGKITEGHARAILSLKGSPNLQTTLLHKIEQNGWSVRQAEQYVVTAKTGSKDTKTIQKRMAIVSPETKRISTILHTLVSLKRTARGGRIEIHFTSDQELQKLLDLLSGISQ